MLKSEAIWREGSHGDDHENNFEMWRRVIWYLRTDVSDEPAVLNLLPQWWRSVRLTQTTPQIY